MSGDPRLTRRAVLLGALALPLASCRGKGAADQVPTHTAPVDAAALRSTLAAEQALLAEYDAAVAAAPATSGMPYAIFRATHAAHVDALAAALGTTSATPSPSVASSTSGPLSSRDLRALEASTGKTLTDAAVSAVDGSTAALLASVAAAHLAQSHLRFQQTGSHP